MINSLASVHPNARIDETVEIGPFVCIEDDVEIGAGTIIDSNVTICSGVRIGKNCHVFPSAIIGAIPQDLKFKGEKTYTIIGNNNTIRECCTIHRGTASKGKTVIGDNNLIMAYCHVAHDCVVNNHIIMSNMVQLAGEVIVEDHAVLGGGTLVHQFTHIGQYIMLQGGTRVNKDVPPFIIAARDPISFCGINIVGLKRNNFSEQQIETIHNTYRTIFQQGMNISDAVKYIKNNNELTDDIRVILDFIESSPRGIVKGV